jgi:hypothetical protein
LGPHWALAHYSLLETSFVKDSLPYRDRFSHPPAPPLAYLTPTYPLPLPSPFTHDPFFSGPRAGALDVRDVHRSTKLHTNVNSMDMGMDMVLCQ